MKPTTLGLAVVAVALASAPARAAPIPIDGIAAVVDDVILYRSEVLARMRHHDAQLAMDPDKRKTELAELYRVFVRRMVDETLIEKDAKRLAIAVTEAEVETGVLAVAAQNKVTREQLENQIARTGFTTASYRAEIRRQLLEGKWIVQRSVGKIDRAKASDPAAFEVALEKQRASVLAELRMRAFLEIR